MIPFNETSIKISSFEENDKLIIKFTQKYKGQDTRRKKKI